MEKILHAFWLLGSMYIYLIDGKISAEKNAWEFFKLHLRYSSSLINETEYNTYNKGVIAFGVITTFCVIFAVVYIAWKLAV